MTLIDAEVTREVAEEDYYDDRIVTTYTATVTFEDKTYTDTKKRTSAFFGFFQSDDERIAVYSLFLDEGELWINGDISASEPVYVGFYDKSGKLANLRIYTDETSEADKIEITPDIATIKVMWWKAGSMQPNCANAVIGLQ